MNHTYFDSPHGLMNSYNFSTAYDLGRLTMICMKVPLIREIVSTHKYVCHSLNTENPHEYRWENTNQMLKMPGYIGAKTGITESAGPCLAITYEDKEHSFVIILLNSKSMEERWREVPKLVEWAISRQQLQRSESNNFITNSGSLFGFSQQHNPDKVSTQVVSSKNHRENPIN